jgi:putative FmdB family regulatory protein
MPTYEYVCRACGHRFERFQKISDEPTRECPECSEPAVERLISAGAGLVFKGPGFYATDYRKDTPPKETDADRGAEGGAEKGKNVRGSGSSDSSEKRDK